MVNQNVNLYTVGLISVHNINLLTSFFSMATLNYTLYKSVDFDFLAWLWSLIARRVMSQTLSEGM